MVTGHLLAQQNLRHEVDQLAVSHLVLVAPVEPQLGPPPELGLLHHSLPLPGHVSQVNRSQKQVGHITTCYNVDVIGLELFSYLDTSLTVLTESGCR